MPLDHEDQRPLLATVHLERRIVACNLMRDPALCIENKRYTQSIRFGHLRLLSLIQRWRTFDFSTLAFCTGMRALYH